jgi:hypothetical protein
MKGMVMKTWSLPKAPSSSRREVFGALGAPAAGAAGLQNDFAFSEQVESDFAGALSTEADLAALLIAVSGHGVDLG